MTETTDRELRMDEPDESREENRESAQSGGIDMARFGSFITKKRKEKGLTQKQLAERLYISNKAVSKWERSLSLPDVALLEPLARELGVTVTELLRGEETERGLSGEGSERAFTRDEIERMLAEKLRFPETLSEEERVQRKRVKKKRAVGYFSGLCLSLGEMALLFLFRERLGLSLFDLSMGLLLVNPTMLIMGIWPFFFMAEKLPPIYDSVRLSEYAHGGFHMSINGVYFNNRNWPHITKALRWSFFLIPVCWPVVFVLLRWITPDFIWLYGQIVLMLAVMLGGIFVPATVMGKKYE